MPRLDLPTASLPKSIGTKGYDLKPDAYSESDEQNLFDVSKCIIPDSHFSLYPNVFSDDDFSPHNIKYISTDTECYSNKSS